MLLSYDQWQSHVLSNCSRNGGYVTFGDNAKGKIVGESKIGKHPNPTFDDVLLVDGLKHNLLSISQFCDKNVSVSPSPNTLYLYHVETLIFILYIYEALFYLFVIPVHIIR